MWNNLQRKPTVGELEDVNTELDKKAWEEIRSGAAPLRGDSEEEGPHRLRSSQGRRWSEPQTTQRSCPKVWHWETSLPGGPLGLTGGLWTAWTPFTRSRNTCLLSPKPGGERGLKLHGWLTVFLWQLQRVPQSEPTTAQLGWGLLQMRRKLSWENSHLKRCLSRVGTAISGSTSEQPWLLSLVRHPQFVPRPRPNAHPAPLIQARPPSWERRLVPIRQGAHFKGTEPAQAQPSELLLQPRGNSPYPLQSQWQSRSRGQAPVAPGCERTAPPPA